MTSTTEAVETERFLRKDALGRVRTPREKREAILDEFEKSAVSAAGFARLHGIKYQTFTTWVKRRRKKQRQQQSAGGRKLEREDSSPSLQPHPRLELAEVVLEKASAQCERNPARCSQPLRVKAAGGEVIEIASSDQLELAVELLRALKSC